MDITKDFLIEFLQKVELQNISMSTQDGSTFIHIIVNDNENQNEESIHGSETEKE